MSRLACWAIGCLVIIISCTLGDLTHSELRDALRACFYMGAGMWVHWLVEGVKS